MELPETPAVNTPKEPHLPKVFLPVLLTFILTSLFVGGTIWGWQEAKLKSMQATYEARLQGLESQTQPEATAEEEFSPQTNRYTNETLKISLDLPVSWQGRYEAVVVSKDPSFDSDLGSITSLNFNYLGQRRKELLFSINQTDALTWSDIQYESPVPTKQKLYEEGNVVYYYDFPIDNPYSDEEAADYQKMADQVENIIATFKLLTQEE